MQRSIWSRRVALGVLLSCAALGGSQADVVPPPTRTVRLLPSPGCPTDELSHAVGQHEDEALGCLGRNAHTSTTVLAHCTFSAAGAVVKCEARPDKDSEVSKEALACVERALSALKLDPKAGDPKKCRAQIEVSSIRRPYVRPHRGPRKSDPDAPVF